MLYYGRAADSTMLVDLSTIASAQSTRTEKTLENVVQLLKFATSNLEATA